MPVADKGSLLRRSSSDTGPGRQVSGPSSITRLTPRPRLGQNTSPLTQLYTQVDGINQVERFDNQKLSVTFCGT